MAILYIYVLSVPWKGVGKYKYLISLNGEAELISSDGNRLGKYLSLADE